MTALTFFNRARQALAKAVSLDEVKEIRDKAEALRVYAKQAGEAADMERQCAEIRLRAERRIGALLAETVKPGNPQLSREVTIGLSELGITRNQSSKWQLAATLPEAEFERYVSTARELTTAGVVKLAREKERAKASGPTQGGHILTGPASRLWERLSDSSVDLFLTEPPYSEIECYRELAELAAAKLKPGGLCLAYCGQYHLPSVLEVMGAALDIPLDFRHLVRWPPSTDLPEADSEHLATRCGVFTGKGQARMDCRFARKRRP